MRRRICIAVIVMLSARHVAVAAETAAAFVPAAVASAGPAPADKPADKNGVKQADEKSGKKEGKDDGKKGGKTDGKTDKPPACMHCGATCGLEKVCVCECGTKKQPRTEYDVTCEDFCVAGCGGLPWPLRRACRAGCTDCGSTPCNAHVRTRKKLGKEVRDEEVPAITRKVAYVCQRCAGRPPCHRCRRPAVSGGHDGWWWRWLAW